ncbi:MAG: MFS transporter [Spongiibacteraceae bacterium]
MLTGGLPPAFALMALSSVLPKIDAALAHNANESFLVKQLIGVVGLAMVVAAPLSGFLVHRIGLNRLLTISLIIYVITGAAGLYIDELHWLLFSRLGVGITGATIQVACLTLINTRLDEAERARWMGRHFGTTMLTTLLIHPVVGILGDISWRLPFAIYLAGLLLIPVASRLSLSATAIFPSDVKNSGASNSFVERSWREQLPWRHALLALVLGGIAYLPTIYASYLLRGIGVNDTKTVAFVLTADALAGVGMAMFYGRIRRILSYFPIFMISLLVACCGAIVSGLSQNLVGIFIGLALIGLGNGWFVPNLMTSLAQTIPMSQQGKAVGMVKASTYLAAPIFITLAEPFFRQFGARGVMLSVSLLAIIVAILLWSSVRRGKFLAASMLPALALEEASS